MPDISHLRERRKLAEQLRAAREGTGMSGNRFAGILGWQQSRVSRIETGAIFPTLEDVRSWALATAADESVLLTQHDRARAEYASWREQGVGAGGQVSIAQLERASEIVAKFQPVIIPSQLRTAGYADILLRMPLGPMTWGLREEDIPARLAAQMDRQKILYEPGRRFRIVILEAALTTRLVPVPVMAGQLDRLVAITVGGVPALDFRIVPANAQVPVFPLSGFVIFDDHLVSIETIAGEQRISDAEGVKTYREAFSLLYESGIGGRVAGALIRSILSNLGVDPGQ